MKKTIEFKLIETRKFDLFSEGKNIGSLDIGIYKSGDLGESIYVGNLKNSSGKIYFENKRSETSLLPSRISDFVRNYGNEFVKDNDLVGKTIEPKYVSGEKIK